MKIIFYAGSLRPGGGLTVAKIMIEALAENPSNNILVYTGAKDSSLALKSVFDVHENVHEFKFLHNLNSELRYLISKFYFLPKSLFNKQTLLISINYYIPAFCKLLVYHLNLLSFMRQKDDTFSKKIKEYDAKLACKYATVNVFESDYLKDTAEKFTGVKIRNPKRLYIGVDPEFTKDRSLNSYCHNANILLVSSPQPYKDNHTCIDALKILHTYDNTVNWHLTIVGGQSIEQWVKLKDYATQRGIQDTVTFLGPVDKNRLANLMQQSLCLISASKVESFCMVALEAMAARCPTVVTNETSMPETVGDAAIIIDSGAPEQFTQAIIRIYKDKGLRGKLLKKGEERSMIFSIKEFIKNLLKLTKEVT